MSLTSAKKWYQSKTILSGIVTVISGLAALVGHDISLESQQSLTDLLVILTTIFGGTGAVVGRVFASEKIN